MKLRLSDAMPSPKTSLDKYMEDRKTISIGGSPTVNLKAVWLGLEAHRLRLWQKFA